jgi:hypothetical protein
MQSKFGRFLTFLIFLSPAFASAIDPVVLYGPITGLAGQTDIASTACLSSSITPANAGKSDFVLGYTPLSSTDFGRADVISGQNGSSVVFSQSAANPDTDFGVSAASAGDLNTDGLTDYIVGEPGTNNAYIFLSNSGFFSETPVNTSSVGLLPGDAFGAAVAGIYDSLGSVVNVVAVGAPRFGENVPSGSADGLVAFFNGQNGAFRFRCLGAANSGETFGSAIASIGDVNGDGVRDILIGAPTANGNNGRIVVLSGLSGNLCSVIYSIPGTFQAQLGVSVAGLGDLDGDGVSDFIAGAPATTVVLGEGAAYVYSGATGNVLCTINGAAQNAGLGRAVSALGDANSDKITDFIIGAPGDGSAILGTVSGYAYNRTTASCDTLFTVSQATPGNTFGSFLSSSQAGDSCDMNGDQKPEFIVGALSTDGGPASYAVVYSFPTPTPTPTITPTSTPTPTITPTSRPRHTATPTPTPTPQLPSRSRLTYRISLEGDLSGEIILDKDPHGLCKTSLIARYSNNDLSGVSNTTTVFRNIRSRRSQRFSLSKLSKPLADAAKKPFILHMIAKVQCGKKTFSSNVYSRYLTCGVKPKVPIAVFMSQLAGKR